MEDPSQLEDAITHLVSDLSSSVSEDHLSDSPVPNEQYVKAAMVSQHLPPAAAQASKLGIKKIDHYLVVQGKGNRTPKQSSKTNNNKYEKQESPRSIGKTITIHDVTHIQDTTDPKISAPLNDAMVPNNTSVEQSINVSRDPGTSHLNVPRSLNILSPVTVVNEPKSIVSSSLHENPCDIKVEHAIDVFKHQQEPIIEYHESGIVDNSIASDTKTSHQYSLKRIYSDEDIRTSCNKKRHSNVTYVSDKNDEPQNVSYVDCRPFVTEEYLDIPTDFNQYSNIGSQSLKLADSPNSTLNEGIVDYQQVDSSVPLLPPNPDDEFIHDLKDDPLLSPSLDANPGTY